MTMTTSVITPVAIADDRSVADLERIAALAIDEAKQQGASAAAAGVSKSQGMSVNVRLGEVDTVEHNRDKGLGVTVYFGARTGSASTADFSDNAVRDSVRAACTIAKYTAEDPANGLADPDRLAKNPPDLDLYHPWSPSMDEAIDIAEKCESIARGSDERISNSNGASLSSHEGVEVSATSDGFMAAIKSSHHSVYCSVIAGQDDGMQTGSWYTMARKADDMESVEHIGLTAATRACERLGARQIETCKVPVIYEAPVASSLLRHFIGAISGGALYRKASFLLDSLGESVFQDHIRIHEQPHLPRALGSAAFDSEGVATEARDIIDAGVLKGYVLSSYSARKLGMETTGNAGGVRNLTIESSQGSDKDLPALLAQMGRGLLITDLIGHGVNTVTGDYSRGAGGFWIENGEIQYPVEEITVAGNLKDIFQSIVAVGGDVDKRGSYRTGSMLIEQMTVAGA